ncbi:hypothetical protein RvY_06044-2 [Ramazzottius varieornatus]|uniref:Flavin-containing monooxygenase n=1 Tax=Ramazzottius varieornatus TaxID=947166 RepID=A0A1D1V6T7_RAMVA|nr:hypothetical protein RvY_06044-2 [Ramazzottius varieornatus]
MAQNGERCHGRKRVAVVGAGMTGLCAIRHFAADPNYEVVAFERANTIAGIWNYPEGCEEHVNQPETSPYYCRTYRDLKTNSPRELSCYPDFPFADTVKDTYCTRETVLHYFHAYAKHFDLLPHIKFRHQVKLVTPVGGVHAEGPVRWTVEVLDLESDKVSKDEFDSVLVCSGHYHKPYLPEINGLDKFTGHIMHSCDYRVPEKFKGQNVLLIGAKVSGNDIACEIAPFANQVQLSFLADFLPLSKSI